jgi:hypothetical protein
VKKSGDVWTTTSVENCTLHWAYLEFAIRSSAARASKKKPPSIPVSRNVIEAIRYSYDFLDAAAEFAYARVKDGPDGDLRADNWLRRYVDRNWPSLSLGDRLGFISFSMSGQGFWFNDDQYSLFEDLKTMRNALTHPGIFGVETVQEFADLDSPALSSKRTVLGKMRRHKRSRGAFGEHPSELGRDDARKAVEIALRHAVRLDELLCRKGETYFSRIVPQTGKIQSPATVLARKRHRYFDALWL